MSTFRITAPPGATMCSMTMCPHTATVRVLTPGVALEVLDLCFLCWPSFRRNVVENGHEITDITGEVDTLVAGYPGSTAFRSDEGILYVSVPVPGTPRQRMTLDGFLVSQVRAQLEALAQQTMA